MLHGIAVKGAPIEDALKVDATIAEFGKHYTKESFEERCLGKEKLIIVAYLDKQPVGYIVGYDRFGDGSFYCWMAGVSPGFRGKGVLKALMNHQEEWAKKKGHKKIKIKTRNNRREMLAYLTKYGFNFTEAVQHQKIEDNRILAEKEI